MAVSVAAVFLSGVLMSGYTDALKRALSPFAREGQAVIIGDVTVVPAGAHLVVVTPTEEFTLTPEQARAEVWSESEFEEATVVRAAIRKMVDEVGREFLIEPVTFHGPNGYKVTVKSTFGARSHLHRVDGLTRSLILESVKRSAPLRVSLAGVR